MVRAALTIAAKDLRQRFRDRSALVLGFIAPFVIATLMNFAFAGTANFHVNLGLVDLDRSDISAQIASTLHSTDLRDILTVTDLRDTSTARKSVDDGKLGAAVVVPAGFGSSVAGDGPAALDVLTTVDAAMAGEVARSIAASFTTRLSAVRLSVTAALAGGASHDAVAAIVAKAVAMTPAEIAAQHPTGDRQLKGVAYYGPAMAMFFVLFAIGFTARGFFIERRDGTLDRMVAAPLHPFAVLAGKALSVFVYALASLLTMSFVVGAVFHASWGSPLGVAALCVAMALAVVALAALVMSLAHTERQAETMASAITFALALLGGNFVFLGSAPTLLRHIASFTPNGLALRAFTDLGTGAAVAGALTRPLIGIAVFTALVGGAATLAGRRAVVQ